MRTRDRPNIVFILADDQAPWTLGTGGFPNAHTPVLDGLARQGARFTNMCANAAVCSPARAALITGRYPSEVGFGPDGRVWLVDEERHLAANAATWPQLLRDHGYRTALIGKWHLGHRSEAQHPTRNGYERACSFSEGKRGSRDPRLQIDGVEKVFTGEYTSDVLADLTLETLRQWREEPFAISLHFWAPHANTTVPDDVQLPYQDRTWLPMKSEDLAPWMERTLIHPNPDFPNLDLDRLDRMTREYHASVHSVDRNVGRVLRGLEALGLADDTIVVFTSDQGYNMGHNGIWHKGNGWWITRDQRDPCGIYPGRDRPNLYDNSIRVPCMVRWPGRVEPGTVVKHPVSSLDWFPTLRDAAGIPAQSGPTTRGLSLQPLLEGHHGQSRDARVFAQHDRLRCCRTPGWKFILNAIPGQPDELYNLVEDPDEHHNRIGECGLSAVAEVHAKLKTELFEWMREIADPLLTELNCAPEVADAPSIQGMIPA